MILGRFFLNENESSWKIMIFCNFKIIFILSPHVDRILSKIIVKITVELLWSRRTSTFYRNLLFFTYAIYILKELIYLLLKNLLSLKWDFLCNTKKIKDDG